MRKPRRDIERLEGMQFHRWTVIDDVGRRTQSGAVRWRCRCVCGKEGFISGLHLKRGASKSCGCLRDECASRQKNRLTHGLADSKIYNLHRGMMDRCYNPKSHAFDRYGGRGIVVSEAWHDFLTFYQDMGEPALGMTLERKENNGPYSKDNCVWASRKAQANNRRSGVLLTIGGRTQTMKQWAEEVGIDHRRVWARLRLGWTPEDALRKVDGRFTATKRTGVRTLMSHYPET